MTHLLRFSFNQRMMRFILTISDLGSALLFAWLVKKFLPTIPADNNILQVWMGALAIIWLMTYDLDRNFRLNIYQSYARVLKIACWTAAVYVVFFMFTRQFYSLNFLVKVTVIWSVYALAARWLFYQYAPPSRGLALDNLPAALCDNDKIIWHVIRDAEQINLNAFDFVLIDFSKQYPVEIQKLLTHAHVVGLQIFSVPQVIEQLTGKISIEDFNDDWVARTFYIDPFYLRMKRIMDIAIIILLLPIIIPISLFVAAAIGVSMGRPILYRQLRMGLNDKQFTMIKFRTMIVDAENQGAGSTLKNDHRITRLGSFLRKLRLDELPQFYNVLKGDMSLIGPRPEYMVLVENYLKEIPLFQVRHWLRPGITGWAQVQRGYASNQDEMLEKIRHDLFYLKNVSLWLDLIVVFKTFLIIITGFGSR